MDPDQLASSEGSSLFSKKDKSELSRAMVNEEVLE